MLRRMPSASLPCSIDLSEADSHVLNIGQNKRLCHRIVLITVQHCGEGVTQAAPHIRWRGPQESLLQVAGYCPQLPAPASCRHSRSLETARSVNRHFWMRVLVSALGFKALE